MLPSSITFQMPRYHGPQPVLQRSASDRQRLSLLFRAAKVAYAVDQSATEISSWGPPPSGPSDSYLCWFARMGADSLVTRLMPRPGEEKKCWG